MTFAKHWVPIDFVKVGQHILVHLVDPENLNFSFGFFRDMLKALPNESKPEKIISLNNWLDETQTHQVELPPIGKIFHISRCGSTLLSQNLKDTGRFIVLGEPPFFNKIYKTNSFIPASLREIVANKVMTSWNHWTHNQDKRLIIKLSSISFTYRQQITQDFPKSNYLFLLREPIAVIESLVRKPPGYIKQLKWACKLPELPEHSITTDELNNSANNFACKIYLSSLNEIFSAFAEGHEVCDYSNLPQSFPQIVEHFSSVPRRSLKISWCEKYDSKEGEWKKSLYKPINKNVLDRYYGQHQRTLSFLVERYSELTKQSSPLKTGSEL